MGLPKLTTCCFCVDIKTGLEIIGVFNAVLSFIMLVAMIVVASYFGSLMNNEIIESNADAEAEATGLYVISIMLCLVMVAKFLFDLLFIYGVVREHAGIIKAYLIVWCVLFLLSNFLFFLHITDFHASVIVFNITIMGFRIYTALLAYSFYEQINTREEL